MGLRLFFDPRFAFSAHLRRFTQTITALPVVLSLYATGICLAPPNAAAQEVASLSSAEGRVEGSFTAQAGWREVAEGQRFAADDRIRTAAQSRAALLFEDGYLLRLAPRSLVTVGQKAPDAPAELQVGAGKAYFFSRQQGKRPNIRTPQVSASIRGTELVIEVQGDTTTLSVLEGAVQVSNAQGTIDVGRGEQAVAVAGQAPVKRLLVDPVGAVQWALYYPAVLDLEDYADFDIGADAATQQGWRQLQEGRYDAARANFSGTSWRAAMGRSIAAYREGDAVAARTELDRYQGATGAGFELYSASLALSAGEVDQAKAALGRAAAKLPQAPREAHKPLSAGISSVEAIIAVVQNRLTDAQAAARRAVAEGPDSRAAALASSFVRQAQFDLEGARAEVLRVAAREPQSTLIQARLAELELSFGRAEAAQEHLRTALAQEPDNGHALTVRGFAQLTELDAEAAEATFTRAANASPGSGLPLLGLGLAKIRQGALAEGRQLLERAVHLEPNVSLYRSYLGKAFFEEEEYGSAGREYARAIELDPEDPTPFLYSSYLNLAEHRPVQALKDVQRSIERNENRAVFRSKLLLDQDVGVRSASLGQIFNRIGFTELARVEAIKALNRDYSNYSAHFLLADLYRDTHLNERAQITENLLGRLLVPVNFNANALNIGGDASLNEYNALFDRPVDRASGELFGDTQVEALGWRGDYTVAHQDLSYNVGYAGSYRDGFRENDWLRFHQLFTLGQYQVSKPGMLAWDGALTLQDQGDVVLNFDPEAENEEFESKFDGALFRLGYRHRFAPGVNLLAQSFYSYGKFDGRDETNTRLTMLDVTENGMPLTAEPFLFDGRTSERIDVDQHLNRTDLQLIWDTEPVSVVLGVSGRFERLEGKEDGRIVDTGSDPAAAFLNGTALASSADTDQISHREFLYSTWHLTEWMDLDAGVAYEYIDLSVNAFDPPFVDETFRRDQVSPKAGLVLYPLKGTTVRFSYSETLDRTERGDIGPLEPTFVGGFNQVFDGVRGSEQELYGVGIDQEFSENTYAGVSYQRRELQLNIPFIQGALDIDRDTRDITERFREGLIAGSADIDRVRSYLYQVLTDRSTFALRYDYEIFDEANPFPESRTNRGEARLNYFHPEGWFGFVDAVFRYQEIAGSVTPKEIHDFWVLDAGLGYEFDHRHGAVSLSLLNLLDRDFKYVAITDEDRVVPRFGAVLNLSLNF